MLYSWKPFATWMQMQMYCNSNEHQTQGYTKIKKTNMDIHDCCSVTLSYNYSLPLVTNPLCTAVPIARMNCARKRMGSEHRLVERCAHNVPVSGSAGYH